MSIIYSLYEAVLNIQWIREATKKRFVVNYYKSFGASK